MLDVQNLTKSFPSPDSPATPALPVVQIQNFHLPPGQHVALLGSSGAGKTTFLHLLAGILTPDTGSIRYTLNSHSTDITTLSEPARDHFRGRHIGYIFQTHHLLPGLTALENVLLGMSFTGRSPSRDWATHLLESVGLAQRLHHKPAKLSLGQQQRVAVARALANRPNLVLADEPTGSLDPASALTTLDLIRSLCKETSAALLLVTHDSSIAEKLDRQIHWNSLSTPPTLAEAPK